MAFQHLTQDRPQIRTLITGMGRKNAARAVREYLAGGTGVQKDRLAGTLAPPAVVFTCGFAGGLNPELKVGDVVFETNRPELEKALLAAGAKAETFHCADRIAATAAAKAQLRSETGAGVVEMESTAIREVCQQQGIACATVRVISDAADEDLPVDFNQITRPDMTLDYAKLAWTIVKSPGKIASLRRFQKQTEFAADRLAEVLVRIVPT